MIYQCTMYMLVLQQGHGGGGGYKKKTRESRTETRIYSVLIKQSNTHTLRERDLQRGQIERGEIYVNTILSSGIHDYRTCFNQSIKVYSQPQNSDNKWGTQAPEENQNKTLIYRYVFGISMSPSDKPAEDKQSRVRAPEFLRKTLLNRPRKLGPVSFHGVIVRAPIHVSFQRPKILQTLTFLQDFSFPRSRLL